MCGIFGYIGSNPAGPLLVGGLKKLEYRGYDSCGIASVNDVLHIRKGVGKIDDVEKKINLSGVPGTAGLCHSRWATHGGVTKENAHPHTDCSGKIALVHNGIIENFQFLKEELTQSGHVFLSETDTEVIAHLVESQSGALEARVRNAVLRLEGSFALLVLSSEEPDKMIVVRKESPMAVGLGSGEFFAASDVMPFLSHTRKVVFMDDGEMAVLSRTGVVFSELLTGLPIVKAEKTLDWNEESASKGGFDHFMLKEILEQPAAIRLALHQDPHRLDLFLSALKSAKRIKLVACGTSRHAALVGRYLLNRVSNLSAEVYIASEFSYFADQCGPDDLILCVSQSGETADVLFGLRKAKSKGAKIVSLVNVAGSSIDRESDVTLLLNCGPEIAVASTKAFTAQLAIFYLLAFALAGKTDEAVQQLRNVADHLPDFLPAWKAQTKKIAESLTGSHAYFLARGVNFPIALEGALKLKEISYIHAEGMPAGELKHGTLALIEKQTPVFLVNPCDYTHAETLSNGMETKARGARLIGISDKGNDAYDEFIQLPKTPELFYPFVANFPLQLLAYHASVARGLDCDKPRNLAKSVTVR